jgi:hypothetical protein
MIVENADMGHDVDSASYISLQSASILANIYHSSQLRFNFQNLYLELQKFEDKGI